LAKINSREYLSSKISVVFNDKFPDGYQNNVKWWGNFSRKRLHSKNDDGTPKLLTMDVDFGNECSLACPTCFRRDDRVDIIEGPYSLSNAEIISYIKQAKNLGLVSIKILGRGEPFQNTEFLPFLREMRDLGIGVGIFTKGAVLGEDFLAEKYNGYHYSIRTGYDLAKKVYELGHAVYLNFTSFNDDIANRMVGGYPTYASVRNKALINLVEAGFNKYQSPFIPTRLSLINAPFSAETLGEVHDIYKWARQRNIYCVSCPTALSGKGLDAHQKESGENYAEFIEKVQIEYSKIYVYAIRSNLISLESFLQDGPHIYAGAHPCHQVAAGFYLQLSGQVVQCPGRICKDTTFAKDIRGKNLKNIWLHSPNGKMAAQGRKYNYHCVARDGISLPKNFYDRVRELTMQELSRQH